MPDRPQRRPTNGEIAVRYVLPGALVLAGLLCLFVAPSSSKAEGFALFTGAGLSVLLLNQLFRIGVTGDSERDDEEAARPTTGSTGAGPTRTAQKTLTLSQSDAK